MQGSTYRQLKPMMISINDEKHELDKKKEKFLPFLMDQIPEAFVEKAKLELDETLGRKTECLQEMKERIKDEETLNDIEFHSDVLIQFLRHSKYEVKKALSRLVNFVSTKRKHSPYFGILTGNMFETIKSANALNVLPRRTPDGCVVLILKYGNWDPSEIPWNDFNCFVTMLLQQSLRDPMTQINGFKCIHDWKNMSFRLMRQMTPNKLYEGSKAYLDCIPARYKEIHMINQPSAFNMVWAILKPLLSEKLKRRVVFHSSPKELLDHIPPAVLPVQYGGCLNEELYESAMSYWLQKAKEEQMRFPLGGQCNYY